MLKLSLVSHLDDIEPVRGLPELLPPGEKMIWQGSPDWKAISIRVFQARKMAIYFALLLIWRFAQALMADLPIGEAARAASPVIVLSIAPVGFLVLLGWLTSWATVYTITTRRLVMRIGILFTINVNIPFKIIESADVRVFRRGNGDIYMTLAGKERVSYVALWPHVRPWRFKPVQPMLRGLPNVREAADILAKAIQEAAAEAEKESKSRAQSETASAAGSADN
jgi:hypothetical protein